MRTTKIFFLTLFFCSIPFGFVQSEDDSELVLRVLCYNIRHGRGMDDVVDLERTANVIMESKPDLVAVQEVDRHTTRTDKVDQPKRLAELTGMHYVFGKAIDYQGGDYGLVILSRFPILEHKMILLPPEVQQEKRGVLVAKIGIPDKNGKVVNFACTHLSVAAQSERETQIDEINALLSKENIPTILAGDFNAIPKNNIITRLLTNWKDSDDPTFEKNLTPYRTKKIDYIFFRSKDPFKVLESKTIEDKITSDHMPIFSVISL